MNNKGQDIRIFIMKRSDIVRSIQVCFKRMRASDAAAILDTVSDHIIESVANGDRIEVRGFGTFQPRARATKIGYNPFSNCTCKLNPSSTSSLA